MTPPGGNIPNVHDWSARARDTAINALRYTQFVGVMKHALPAAAFAVIAAVAAFFVLQRQPGRVALAYQRLGLIDNDLAMIKPHLAGVDAKGDPFVITADKAIQEPGDTKRAHLTNVEADFTLGKTGWINARAGNGLVDLKANTLALDGGIQLFSDTGYELQTRTAQVDLHSYIVTGHDTVTGQGPNGTLRADSFRVENASRQLSLDGHVHMTVTGFKK
jgi:lipopolysaccharide export system protein LptC